MDFEDSYKYIGCFLPRKEKDRILRMIDGNRLFKVIPDFHVTFSYLPEYVDESLFGEEVYIRIIGYGNDGTNEGLQVELSSANGLINQMIADIELPHITLSVSEDGKSVNTRFLHFSPIDPIVTKGYFGGCMMDSSIRLEANHSV